MINSDIPQGTVVKFTADARLRQITSEGRRSQSGMAEGVVIGEKLEAVVVQRLGTDAYSVVFTEGGHFGWVYNFELYVKDINAPLVKLNLVSQKK